jgi:hypothetical protein
MALKRFPETKIGPGEIIGVVVGGDVPETEVGHFYLCPECGQAVDERRSWPSLASRGPDHEPLRVSWRVRLEPPIVRHHRADMERSDPSEVLAWLGTLPLTERLVTLPAMTIVFPALQHSRSWKARIAAVRDALGPSEVELGYILRAAERRSVRLKKELAGGGLPRKSGWSSWTPVAQPAPAIQCGADIDVSHVVIIDTQALHRSLPWSSRRSRLWTLFSRSLASCAPLTMSRSERSAVATSQ